MALELIGWLDGGTALAVVLSALILGLISIYKGIKLKAKLLTITGLCIICIGFVLLGPAVDFLTILITNNNLQPMWLYGLLSYAWTGPLTLFGLYIGAELMMPRRKWILLSIFFVLVVIFEFLLFFYSFTNPDAIFIYPEIPPMGTALLNTSIALLVFSITQIIINNLG